LLLVFLDTSSFSDVMTRIRRILVPLNLLFFCLSVLLIFLPQFIYWHYLSGSFFFYSYPGESFLHYLNPRLLSIWFSPLNGIFIYTPIAAFILAGMVVMIVRKKQNGILISAFFLLISYIFSSWHSWFFGGSFGYRPFVEYYSLFSVPLAHFLVFLWDRRNLFFKSGIIFLLVLSVYYNLVLTYNLRWNTASTWSWDDYLVYLDSSGLYHSDRRTFQYIRDFENPALGDAFLTRKHVHSPTIAYYVNPSIEFNILYQQPIHTIPKKNVKRVHASIWIYPEKTGKTGSVFYCSIENWKHDLFFSHGIQMDTLFLVPDQWNRIQQIIELPEWINQEDIITFSIWNQQRREFFLDDLILYFE
jgi:hypothetical protein